MVTLSSAQQAAVDHRGGDLQLIACAGSGKTESLSRRVAALLAEGVPPAAIVAFTFTERAAAELRERIVNRAAERMGESFRDQLGPLYVGTIHAWCFRQLQDHVPTLGSHEVIDDNRLAALLSRHHKGLGLDALRPRHWEAVRDFATTLDVLGNELIPDGALSEPLRGIVGRFRVMAERYRLLTYGDLITRVVALLDDPTHHGRICGHLQHLIVDEFQDVNPAQVALVERIARPPVQLCVVGDDDQAIYQWRGSDVRHIVDFAKQRPGTTAITLDQNRRSRPPIIEAAAAFADTIPHRLPKQMQAVREAAGPAITAWRAPTPDDEAHHIADTMQRLHAEGFAWRELAVLYRSVRTAAGPLLRVLDERGIPYQCGGRSGLFQQPDVSALARCFAWLIGQDWTSDPYGTPEAVTLDDLVNRLTLRFGEAPTLRAWLTSWQRYHKPARHAVSLVDDLYELLDLLGAPRLDPNLPAEAARLGALARFAEVLADFEHVNRRGHHRTVEGVRTFQAGRDRGPHYFFGLFNYLQHWALGAYEDFPGEPRLAVDAVDILTVHQAKGLEWPVVFLPGLNVRRFPSQRSGQARDWLLDEDVFPAPLRRRYEGGDGEERRLFYVAMTRARDMLYPSCFQRVKQTFKPSPYLLELANGQALKDLPVLPLPTRGGPSATAPEAPPPEVGFSDLATLDDCGHAWRLGSNFGFPPPLAEELGYGKAVHHTLRLLAETTRTTGAVPDRATRAALLEDAFYVPFATEAAHASMAKFADRLVETYVRDHGADLHRIWAVERPFTLHFDEGVVTGRADLILDREQGAPDRLALVDYKVGADDDHRDPRYALQLQVYTAAGRLEGLEVTAAYLHHLRHSVRTGVDVQPRAVNAAHRRMGELLRRLRAGEFKPRPASYRCGGCNLKRLCPHRVE